MKKAKITDKYDRDDQGIIGEKLDIRGIPGHHTGKRGQYGSPGSGYKLRNDRTYELAPCEREPFENINSEIQATYNLINYIIATSNDRLVMLEKKKRERLMRLADMVYRGDDADKAVYNSVTNILSFTGDVAPEAPNKALEERIDLDKAGAGKVQEPK